MTSQKAYVLKPATVPKWPRSPSTPRPTAIHQVMTFGGVSFIVASPWISKSLRAGSDVRPGCGRVGQPAGGVAWRKHNPMLSGRPPNRPDQACGGQFDSPGLARRSPVACMRSWERHQQLHSGSIAAMTFDRYVKQRVSAQNPQAWPTRGGWSPSVTIQPVARTPRLPRNKKVNTNPARNPPMCAM